MSKLSEKLIPTICAICKTDTHDRQLYAANFDQQDLSPQVFSARRLPDRVHYRLVVCRNCGLIRSNPVLNETDLSGLYQASRFTYAQEAQQAAQTYADYFFRHVKGVDGPVLEVGCGNGSFLQLLHTQGLHPIYGIEPSVEAVEQAGPVKGLIHTGLFSSGIYSSQYFQAICAFQVFDHLTDPVRFLQECHDYLKPQGTLFLILHDIGAWTARLLGRRCPMVDIEHPFLYNKATIKTILEANGFAVREVFAVSNCYALRYWVQLAPLPAAVKTGVLQFLRCSALGRMMVRLNLGNIGVAATRM